MNARLLTACFGAVCLLAVVPAQAADDDWDKKVQSGEDWYNKDHLWEAQNIYEQCLAEAKDFKPEDPRYVRIRVLIGQDYLTLSKWQQAQTNFNEAVAAIEKKSGETSTDLLIPLIGLAMAADLHHDRAEAVRLLNRAQAILANTKEENQVVLDATFHLSEVCLDAGRLSVSEDAAQKSIQIINRTKLALSKPWNTHGPNDVMLRALVGQGKIVAAQEFAQRVVDNAETLHGKDSYDVGEFCLAIGHVYGDFGKFNLAQPFFERALDVLQKQPTKSPSEIGITHYFLAQCFFFQGNPQKAKEHLPPAIEGMKFYPARQIECCELQFQIETYLQNQPEAEAAMRRAIEIDLQNYGKHASGSTTHYRLLAECLLGQMKYDEAAAAFSSAIENAQVYFGKDSQMVAGLQSSLAYTHVVQGKPEQALTEFHDNLVRLAELQPKFLAQLSDHHRLDYIRNSRMPWEHFFSLVLKQQDKQPDAVSWAHQAALALTGTALDSAMAEQEAAFTSGNPELEQLRAAIANARQQVAGLYTRSRPGEDSKNAQRNFENAVAQLDKLDAEFAAKSAPYASVRSARTATVKGMQERLPPGTALVTIFPCTRYAFKIMKNAEKPVDYLALVLTHDHLSPLIDLGSVADLNAAARALRAAVYGAAGSLERDGEAKSLAALQPLTARVSALLLQPLWPELKDSQRWLLSFDGELAMLPIHILPLPDAAAAEHGSLVIDRAETSFLNSPRDVMLFGIEATGKGAMIIAGPDFNLADRPQGNADKVANPAEFFKELPGALEEGAAVARQLETAGVPVTLKTGADATKTALLTLKAPRFLHVSTHGYYLADRPHVDSDAAERGIAGLSTSAISAQPVQNWLKNLGCPECGTIHDPLMRSGLAFSGANRLTPGESIATARELAGLNLWGTELVVLSACETGEGVPSLGEGVVGLRRSFALSGSQRVMTSLWPIPDLPTKELMTAFYAHRLKNERTAAALRNAMQELRSNKATAHPFSWAAFILVGDPN